MRRPRFVLYPKNKSAQLDLELFRNPTAEYRGAPFWSWNSRVDVPQLLRELLEALQLASLQSIQHQQQGRDKAKQ